MEFLTGTRIASRSSREIAVLMPDDPVVRFGLAGVYWMPSNRRMPGSNTRKPFGSNPTTRRRIVGLSRALEKAGRLAEAETA